MEQHGKMSEFSSRRAILERLKELGPQDAKSLADHLRISPMGIRQHLYGLHNEKLVAYEEEARPIGRPAKIWRLTPAADVFFPDGHAELTVSLIDAMKEAFGPDGLVKLLAVRSKEQIAAYRRRVKRGDPLKKRLKALAVLRSEEGYMAAVEPDRSGGFLLVENHCPICVAASSCRGLCAAELMVFQTVLGEDVQVERGDHILAGAQRCAYRVRPRPGKEQP